MDLAAKMDPYFKDVVEVGRARCGFGTKEEWKRERRRVDVR